MNEQYLSLSELENFDGRSPSRGKERRFCCPRCGFSKPKDAPHRSLAVNTETGAFYCHRCETKGRLKEFWEEKPKVSKSKRARMKLMSHFSISETNFQTLKPEKVSEKEESAADNLAEKMLEYQKNFVHSPGEMYLSGRGILTAIAVASGCGFAEKWEHWERENEKWKKKGTDRRVIFPVINREEKIVALHTRTIDEECLNSSKITRGNKSDGVFMTRKNIFASKIIAVCEAPIDALALEMCGIPSVAMIGTTAPDWLGLKLSFKNVLIATDADQAGDKAAFNLQRDLMSRGAKIYRLRPRNFKDWSEVLEKLGAEKMSEFLLPFAENLSDEMRFSEAVRLYESGRTEAFEFVANCMPIKIYTDLREHFLNLQKTVG